MNTTDLSRRVAEENGWSYRLSYDVVFATIRALRNSLAEGNEIKLHKLGMFTYLKRGGYPIHSQWAEGGIVDMPVAHYIKFIPTDELKEQVKGLDNSVFEGSEESSEEAE